MTSDRGLKARGVATLRLKRARISIRVPANTKKALTRVAKTPITNILFTRLNPRGSVGRLARRSVIGWSYRQGTRGAAISRLAPRLTADGCSTSSLPLKGKETCG